MAAMGSWAVMVVCVLAVSCAAQSPVGEATVGQSCGQTDPRNETLGELMEDYFQWKLHTYPEWATLEGFKGYNHLVEDYSMAGVLAKFDKCQEFLDRSCGLGPAVRGRREVMHRDILETELRTCVEGKQYKGYLLPPVNFLEGLQLEYPKLVSDRKRTPLGSLQDYEDLLARIKLLPTMVAQVEALLREGVVQGVTYARESLRGVDEQFEKLQVPVDESDFYVRFRDMPGSLGRHVVSRMKDESFALVEDQLLPALRKLQDYLKYEYSGAVRGEPAVSSNQGGKEFYTAVLRWHTSTDLSPQEVHDIGLQEVQEIMSGVAEVLGQLEAGNQTFQEFAASAREDPAQVFGSREEALETYREILARVQPGLEQLLPRDTLTDSVSSLLVAAAPNAGPSAYYEGGSRDGARQGTMFVQLQPLKAQKRFEAVTLTLHEGTPGHHYQFEFNRQQTELPKFMVNPMFRRYSEAPSRFPMNTAHVEGWGLYSEYLGFEMGLYQTDLYARFGHYSYNLLRACRLVVDTGIHALGWTRDRAVDYMLANTALSKASVEREVDRYITWPGQACAYKIGERKIKELRVLANKQMGDRFDVREFHRTVLACLGPLSALERCVAAYVQGSTPATAEEDSRVVTPTVASSGGLSGGGGLGLLLILLLLLSF